MVALLEAAGLAKSYAGHLVLDDVDFVLRPGERVALIGENGAGKSTFARILAGAVAPDRGELRVNGSPVSFHSPRDALRHGVAFIPQELAYVPELTVGENVMLGRWPGRAGLTSRRAAAGAAAAAAAEFGIAIDVDRRMSALTLADQQVVEIVKALARRAAVVILDEPTATLSDHEANDLFEILAGLSAGGVGVLYISHRLDEVHRLADRVDVFRNGRLVASVSPREAAREQLVAFMLGQAAEDLAPGTGARPGVEPVLELRGWRAAGTPGLREVSLTVGRGEVVGLFGLRGCGSELVAEGLAGRHRGVRGLLSVAGRAAGPPASPLAARRAGIGYVPADRKREALVLPMSVRGNLGLLMLRRLSRLGVIRRRLSGRVAAELARRFDVRSRSLAQPVGELSGGNQQKVMLAGRLAPRPPVLVLQEPTRGVDVGARLQIHGFLRQVCAEGTAVLMVTSDVEEAVAVSDRLLVMREGGVVAELSGAGKTQGRALRLAAGAAG